MKLHGSLSLPSLYLHMSNQIYYEITTIYQKMHNRIDHAAGTHIRRHSSHSSRRFSRRMTKDIMDRAYITPKRIVTKYAGHNNDLIKDEYFY